MSNVLASTEEPEVPAATAPVIQQANKVPYVVPKDAIPVEDIEPFNWSIGLHVQVVKQGYDPPRSLPKGAIDHIRAETKWVLVPDHKPDPWTREQAISVSYPGFVCPYCNGDHVIRRQHTGFVTGLRVDMPVSCLCGFNRNFYSRWLNPMIVPTDYRNIRMNTMPRYRAAFKSFTDAAFNNLLTTVQQYKLNCFLMVGPAGTGKTTLMIAMYHNALVDWCARAHENDEPTEAVWKINALELSKQLRIWELRDVRKGDDLGRPTEIMTGKVHAALRAGYKPCLFLDGLDKIKLDSDFQARKFASIIDLIQSNGGQVVATSNLNEQALREALGSQYGPGIVRRLCGPRWSGQIDGAADPEVGGFLLNFWSGTAMQNYLLPEGVEEDQAMVDNRSPWAKARSGQREVAGRAGGQVRGNRGEKG